MTDFDLDLINEYKRFPVFYNRKCQGFKNKVLIDRAWNIIGRSLCYNADLLRTRMSQLRNRYSLEKRKLLALRKEGIPNPEPSWGLFHNLNFLKDHIKQRRPYRKRKLIDRRYSFYEGFSGFTVKDLKASLNRYRSHNDDTPNSYFKKEFKINEVQQHRSINSHLDRNSQILTNIQTLKQSLLQDGHGHPYDKFKAFGSFLTMSLQDLPQDKALVLIQGFTGEIVRAFTEPTPELSNNTMCDSILPSTSHKLKAELIELKNANRAFEELPTKNALVITEKLSSENDYALTEPTPDSSHSALCATIQASTSHKIKTELIELENSSSAWFQLEE